MAILYQGECFSYSYTKHLRLDHNAFYGSLFAILLKDDAGPFEKQNNVLLITSKGFHRRAGSILCRLDSLIK